MDKLDTRVKEEAPEIFSVFLFLVLQRLRDKNKSELNREDDNSILTCAVFNLRIEK